MGAQPVARGAEPSSEVQHALELGAGGFQQDDPLARTDLDELLAQPGTEVRNVELIGYSDLDGRPGFKLALQVVGERWYLYVGHLWHRGWSVLDVTNPAHPRVERFWPGPDNTWTIQTQAAEGRLLTALERMPPAWGGDSSKPHAETAIVWDAANPTAPVELPAAGEQPALRRHCLSPRNPVPVGPATAQLSR